MKPHLIDGRSFAMAIKDQLARHVVHLYETKGNRPGLAIVRIGEHVPSQIYVSSKKQQCSEIGIRSFEYHFPETTPEEEIIKRLEKLNEDPEIHGIIIQLPIPAPFNKNKILQNIAPAKDVDGLHPLNMGKLFCGLPTLIPCTPKGCLKLIHSVKKDLKGLHAVVIGTSNLVGRPLAQLLLQEGCTVTSIHSKTQDPHLLAAQGDILVAAAGVPLLVQESWIKSGAIVIDVGINHMIDKKGKPYIVGDVDFDLVKHKVRAISPVPGGVGPMTVACLLENTVQAAEAQI